MDAYVLKVCEHPPSVEGLQVSRQSSCHSFGTGSLVKRRGTHRGGVLGKRGRGVRLTIENVIGNSTGAEAIFFKKIRIKKFGRGWFFWEEVKFSESIERCLRCKRLM